MYMQIFMVLRASSSKIPQVNKSSKATSTETFHNLEKLVKANDLMFFLVNDLMFFLANDLMFLNLFLACFIDYY